MVTVFAELVWGSSGMVTVFALIFFTYSTCPKANFRKKFSIYRNKFFHYCHLSKSSWTCPRLQVSGLTQRLWYFFVNTYNFLLSLQMEESSLEILVFYLTWYKSFTVYYPYEHLRKNLYFELSRIFTLIIQNLYFDLSRNCTLNYPKFLFWSIHNIHFELTRILFWVIQNSYFELSRIFILKYPEFLLWMIQNFYFELSRIFILK